MALDIEEMAVLRQPKGVRSTGDPQKAKRTRQTKPGVRRVTVVLSEAMYEELVRLADRQMREPNNMLSFILAERVEGLLKDYSDDE